MAATRSEHDLTAAVHQGQRGVGIEHAGSHERDEVAQAVAGNGDRCMFGGAIPQEGAQCDEARQRGDEHTGLGPVGASLLLARDAEAEPAQRQPGPLFRALEQVVHFLGFLVPALGHTRELRTLAGEQQRMPHRLIPPSTASTWPVRYDACSEQRKVTAAATSSGVPARRIGVCARIASRARVPPAELISDGT